MKICSSKHRSRISNASLLVSCALALSQANLAAAQLTEQVKLVVSDPNFIVQVGGELALSGDTAMISNWAIDRGSVYVFDRIGGSWVQQQRLTTNATAGFGSSVAISGDTALFGAQFDDLSGVGTWAGSAHVFVKSGTTWTRQAKLKASDAATKIGRASCRERVCLVV